MTDTERREVARRLRKLNESGICIEEQICDLWEIEGGSEYRCDERCDKCRGHVLAYLADLIDPTCLARADVEDTPDGGQFDCWSCSVCGNILSSDPDYDTDTDGPTYCEVCGHRIIGKGEPTWL